MPSFSGKFYYTVDPKGRLIVPASFREIISANYSPKLYITVDIFDKCIHIYPFEEWTKIEEKVKKAPKTNESIRYFMRTVVASAVECEMDKQGRLQIPSSLRIDMGIDGDIVILGLVDKIEIWDKTLFAEKMSTQPVDRKAIETDLNEFGL